MLDPRDLDTFNDSFDEPPDDEPDLDREETAHMGELDDPTCPKCGETVVAVWDHLQDCPHYKEMMDLPF